MRLFKLSLLGIFLAAFWSCSDLGDPEVKGCTDLGACNYDSDATIDDESCLQFDCTNECGGSAVLDSCNVCNGDGSSCMGEILGCMDANACNYNSDATVDNGTCLQLDCANECGGTAVLDDCGVCEGDGSTCVSYLQQIQPIFTSNCNGCHIGGTSGGLNLSVGSSYNNLVNVTSQNYSPALRVNPSSASTSVLWNKIAGGTNGSQMPMNGPYLSQADIDLIETWINEGAQDN